MSKTQSRSTDRAEKVYINGAFVPAENARISIYDRAVLFADSVYEVTAVLDGHLVDFDGHMARLARSCEGLNIKMPMERAALKLIHEKLIRQNALKEGFIYLQVTAGGGNFESKRSFTMDRDIEPNLFMFSQPKSLIENPLVKRGMKIITLDDQRWARRDIKTTQLLSQSLARTQAIEAGYDDAWFVSEGLVNEGASSNAFIVSDKGIIYTRPSSQKILSGITRQAIVNCCEKQGLKLEYSAFSVSEAIKAREAFSTSATSFVLPVCEIDGHKIGSGRPGEITLLLRKYYIEALRQSINGL